MNEAYSRKPAIDLEAAAALMAPLTELVVEAGAAILAVNRRAMKVEDKHDGSPLTEADLCADGIIGEGLKRLVPEVPALSEERVQAATPPYRGSFFLIDPLDGTKEFIAGRGEFTVNLALVTDATPMLEPGEPWIAAVSRSHGDSRTEAFIDRRPGAVRLKLGSAVKFGRLAEGAADIYPRLAPTSEWDVAAGHALVEAAGGKVTDAQGRPLRFGEGRDGSFIVPAFIAWGDPAAAARLVVD